MSKVISLDDKLKLPSEQRDALERKRKILAVRKVFQCTHCSSKCERCGISVGPEHKRAEGSARIPYNFCDSCAEEYIEYINRLQGKGNIKDYWYNHAWNKVWQAWIEYQGAIDQYMQSKEFRQLLDELKPDGDSSD